MTYERVTGILFSVALLLFVVLYVLSPQPKYSKPLVVEIPDLEKPVFNTSLISEPVKDIDSSFESLEMPKDMGETAAKLSTEDFKMYLYRIGIFSSFDKASELLTKINNSGYMGEDKSLPNDKNKHAVYVIFFTEEEIKNNKSKINTIAGIETGVITPWIP